MISDTNIDGKHPIEMEVAHLISESQMVETPAFIFSRQAIKERYREFERSFPEAEIHYAMKANSEPEVLRTLDSEGCGFEVASVYELRLLQNENISPEGIIYGSAIKPASHIKEVFEYGVDRFVFDSLPELEKIASIAPGTKVYVRISANDAGSVFKFSEKFGTEKENIVPFLVRARELGLVPYGISFHVGSQASNPMAWANALEGLSPELEKLQEAGIAIEAINIGGGYPCAYQSAEREIGLGEISENIYAAYEKLPYKPKLLLEPGRAMIASAGTLVTSVIGRVERRGTTWLFLDAGVYNALFETMAYQGSTRYKITSLRPAHDSGEDLFALAGPTGDSPDILTKEALLPKDIGIGDKLIVHDVGAYSLVTASPFNGFPKPPVYFI